ncbi:hypothetical protein H7X87_04035 [Acetobacteraceae bacterium]|nr:hypothetical protein [Candidatus Parcubacteria bacterium]
MFRRYINLAGIIGLLFFGVPFFASATVYQQSDSGTKSAVADSGTQFIGNNISGQFQAFSFYVEGTTHSISIQINECDDAGYTTCAEILDGDISTSSLSSTPNVKTKVTFSALDEYTLQSSKYYMVHISGFAGIYVYGKTASSTNLGWCRTYNGSSPCSLNDTIVKDAYWQLITALDLSSESGIYSYGSGHTYTPTPSMVTPSTIVDFQFDYLNSGLDSPLYIYSGVEIQQLGVTASPAYVVQPITTSGVSTFSDSVILSQGAAYSWRPFLENASSTRLYGDTYNFSVVTQNTLGSPFSASTTNSVGGLIGIPDGTTEPTGNDIVDYFANLADAIGNKIPFSYFIGIINTFEDIDTSGTTGSTTLIALNIASSTSFSVLNTNMIPNLTVTTDTVMKYLPFAVLSGFLLLQAVSFWGMWVWYMYRRVGGLIGRLQ